MNNFMYPSVPSPGKTDTSYEAAVAIKPAIEYLRDLTLRIIRERPSTADEIAFATGESILNIRPRCSELSVINKIFDNGLRRKNINNRNCIVWAACPEQKSLFEPL